MIQQPDEPPDFIDFVCVNPEHIATGKLVPNGQGTFSITRRRWAYCSAGLMSAPHDWQETGGIPVESIDHATLPPRRE